MSIKVKAFRNCMVSCYNKHWKFRFLDLDLDLFLYTYILYIYICIYIYILETLRSLRSRKFLARCARAIPLGILVSHPDASEVVFLICDLSAKNIFQIKIHARCSEKPLVSCFKVGTRLTSDENASPSTNELAGHRSRWAKMRPSGAKMGQKEATMAPR